MRQESALIQRGQPIPNLEIRTNPDYAMVADPGPDAAIPTGCQAHDVGSWKPLGLVRPGTQSCQSPAPRA